ncbi:MAG TPA: ABC transporter transmembrane domain-containing protein [Desulfovibrio sp.]|uniref:ABC transporter ATP-binding protein n=1 Tax=Desulfovibrio sp. TaxID=885 RepID=UPI002BBFF4F2|nr:ABC transporter transmembrane domain-containing protein [Desulfovibrio sp.]HMM39178.1 ABC transporter transmembrane domain-containing protein [Desulfovibrio sp.]
MKDEKKKLFFQESKVLLRRSLGYFWGFKKRLALAVVGMLVVAPCGAATAWLVKLAVDDVLIRKDVTALKLVTFLIFALMSLKGIFRFIQTYYMNSTGLMVVESLRNDLYERLIHLPLRFFNENQVGMLMSRMLNDVALIRQSMPSIVMFVREFFTVIALIGYVIYLDRILAFWGLIVLPIVMWVFATFSRKLRKIGRKTQVNVSDVSVVLQEGLSGIRVIKAFASEAFEVAKFKTENAKYLKSAVKQIRISEQSSRVMEIVGALAAGLVLWYGGMRVIEGGLTPGALLSFLTALAMLYEPIKRMNSANMDIQAALAGAERVFEILDSPHLVAESGGAVELDEPFQALVFEGVLFKYPGAVRPSLDRIDLRVQAGERVAIVGPSGAGKTTLVNLIPRFFEPQEGRIVLNGRPVAEYSLRSLRRSMGIVSQEAFLFNASVSENIAYGMTRNCAREEVEAAANAAFAREFINDLPEGFATLVGERGVKLSGGQKQRLTIARAILNNPPLLILDEATSALDTESERIVQLALDNLMKGRTSIVIAHRLSTVLSADRIVVMEGGRVLDQGRHEELLGRCDLYARLYHMQFSEDMDSAD